MGLWYGSFCKCDLMCFNCVVVCFWLVGLRFRLLFAELLDFVVCLL